MNKMLTLGWLGTTFLVYCIDFDYFVKRVIVSDKGIRYLDKTMYEVLF